MSAVLPPLAALGPFGDAVDFIFQRRESQAGTVEVEDNNGPQSVEVPPRSVVATDNRTFETHEAWCVTLTAAAGGAAPDWVGNGAPTPFRPATEPQPRSEGAILHWTWRGVRCIVARPTIPGQERNGCLPTRRVRCWR